MNTSRGNLIEFNILQKEQELLGKGFKVDKNFRDSNLHFDLVATSPSGVRTAINFKHVSELEDFSKISNLLEKIAQQLGYQKIETIIVRDPLDKKVEINELSNTLFKYFQNEFPSELNQLSTHTRLEDISEVEIDSVNIARNEIHVRGSAYFEVELLYGSNSDNDGEAGQCQSYPFKFDVTLDSSINVIRVNECNIDTSSFSQ